MAELRQLLKTIEVKDVYNEKEEDLTISGVSYHSQKVRDGHIFVCIKGYKTDGHKYLRQAVAKGAIVAVVEDFQEDIDIPQYIVENSRSALARLGAAFYDNPSHKMKVIGITATNGKTTTAFMTNAILENAGLKTGLLGTVSVKIDDYSVPSILTTPESLDLQHYLNEMANKNVSHVTMEVSSSGLELHRVEKVDYDIVTLNNISREHIDFHGSFERYFEFKSRFIKEADEKSVAILNLDCPYSASLVDKTKAQVITFGLNNKTGHVVCRDLDLTTGRAGFTVEILNRFKVGEKEYMPMEFDVKLAVPGLHSVYNSMVAIIIGLLCGVSVPTIQGALKTFGGVERRFEFIFEDDIKIIDDHFANAGNINVTLETLKFMDYEKLHLVYAIRGERGPTVNRENAETIVSWAPKLGINNIIATKSVSHVTSKDRVTNEEFEAFKKAMDKGKIKVDLYDELQDAIEKAISKAKPGDLVLLAGCQGMDYGAEIALNRIFKIRKDFSKEELFRPLEKRVAGVGVLS
ncbi:MAG TPA: UDP-N-acetylmuramoyl-L-alanyl-D-glutamate--2,6-diaminopimelate ligase [Clostridia bacterium]|nr:UDP-N-acetylmuramoyl-L-alanyl-D-glutamate--2,6-diaminopimelate ligase [Clostridia bacterium]